eukprot:6044037-Pleurochrysis_carterae.AAC.1
MENIIHQSQYKSIHLLYDHIAKHYEYFDGGNGDQQKRQANEGGEVGHKTRRGKQATEQKARGNGEVTEPHVAQECVEEGLGRHKEDRAEEEKGDDRNEEGRSAKQLGKQREQNMDERANAGKEPTRERQRGLHMETNIGTLNMSGISFGYRGKYIQTEETLLKIRPGDKLREVVEMMKTQG